ncbi:hypothetical protein PVAP13_2NG022900 [Panicum virgatum]|uniref:Uncharacterized protein n=1 Tax=Panicum virgatum TaxID=38727 RepID=A0A8T0VEB4_PANVG|nr:hypothetical protein PVAP13_2NG022900 [Panicum virgatum]
MATPLGSCRLNPGGKNGSEILYGGVMLRLGMGGRPTMGR